MIHDRVLYSSLLILVLTGCGGEVEESEPALRPVRYQQVTTGAMSLDRTLAGVIHAGQESRLSFRVSGSIERLDIQVGERVRRGRSLARLDPTDFELRVEESKAALAQAEASLRRSEADYERVRSLYENNNASKAELDASRASAESALALVDAVTKQLEQANQQLGYTALRAPTDGAIASVDVEVNENVQAGQQICLLISGGRPEVVIPVPEVMISAVTAGQRVSVEMAALPGRSFPAVITEVGVAVTGAATTYPVTARFEELDDAIRAGMAAEVVFDLSSSGGDDRIFVPGISVGEDREGRYVFVLNRDGEGEGTVERRAVEIGATDDRGIEVTNGLVENEWIVTAGVRRLADGMRVQVLASDEGTG